MLTVRCLKNALVPTRRRSLWWCGRGSCCWRLYEHEEDAAQAFMDAFKLLDEKLPKRPVSNRIRPPSRLAAEGPIPLLIEGFSSRLILADLACVLKGLFALDRACVVV